MLDSLFINAIDFDMRNLLNTLMDKDAIITSVVQALQHRGPFPLNSIKTDWQIVFYRDRCYVLDNLDLRCNIVQRYHDSAPAGHPGHLRTLELVRQDYWWPGLYSFVRSYITGCAICQQPKINHHPSHPPLQPITSLFPHPFSLVTMDFSTNLPPSDGFNSIMVIVDHGSSKGVNLEPCHKTSMLMVSISS